MITYRAAYWTNGQSETVLTGPEQVGLPDAELIEAAVVEAYNGDIVSKDGDNTRLSESALRAGIEIGMWTES